MKKILFLAFSLLYVVSTEAALKKVTAAADPWPPFIDPSNSTQGLSLEIVRAAFETQGIQVEMTIMPWARAEAGVKEGTIDMLPNMWHTSEREKDFIYGEAYASNEIKFIKKKGDAFEFNGMDSLAGKKIGTVNGYGYGDEFLKSTKFTKDAVTDSITNIKKLTAGRVDLTLEDKIVISSMLQKSEPALLAQIEFTKNSLSVNKLHIATGKANKNAKEIIEAYNKGLKAIKDSGKFNEIMKKYGI